MALVPAKCTQCGANIKIDDTSEIVVCEYCETAFVIERVSDREYNIKKYSTDNELEEKQQIEKENLKREEIRKEKEMAEREMQCICPECRVSFGEPKSVCPHCGFPMKYKERLQRLREIEDLENIISSKVWVRFLIYGVLCSGYCALSIFFVSWEASLLWIILAFISGLAAFCLFTTVSNELNEKDKYKRKLKSAKQDYNTYLEQHEKEL